MDSTAQPLHTTNNTDVNDEFRLSGSLSVIHLVLDLVILLVIIVTNSVSLIVLIKGGLWSKQKNMPFLTSLAVADLLVGLLTPAIVYCFEWVPRRYVCVRVLVEIVANIPIYVSVLHLLVIAADRFIAISYPLHYDTMLTPWRLRSLLICIWVLPLVRFYSAFGLKKCIDRDYVWTYKAPDMATMEGVSSVFVLLVLTGLYGRLWYLARKQHTRIQSQEGGKTQGIISMKATKTVSVILLAYLITWTPNSIVKLLSMAGFDGQVINALIVFTYYLGLCNSFVNFFIYIWMNNEFLVAFKKIICRGTHFV
jgi:G protein-coupled receptor 21